MHSLYFKLRKLEFAARLSTMHLSPSDENSNAHLCIKDGHGVTSIFPLDLNFYEINSIPGSIRHTTRQYFYRRAKFGTH